MAKLLSIGLGEEGFKFLELSVISLNEDMQRFNSAIEAHTSTLDYLLWVYRRFSDTYKKSPQRNATSVLGWRMEILCAIITLYIANECLRIKCDSLQTFHRLN